VTERRAGGPIHVDSRECLPSTRRKYSKSTSTQRTGSLKPNPVDRSDIYQFKVSGRKVFTELAEMTADQLQEGKGRHYRALFAAHSAPIGLENGQGTSSGHGNQTGSFDNVTLDANRL